MKLVGPTVSEVEAAKATLATLRRAKAAQVLARARELGRFEGVFGDPSLFDKEDEAFASLTPSDVRAAMARYVLDTRRSIVELYPHGWVRDIGPPVITKTYIVQPGDNLTRIATRYGTTPEQLAKQNGLALSKRITVGQRLLITTNPSKILKLVTHTVAKGQTLIAIGKKYGVSADDIAKANGLTTKKSIRPGQVLQIPPKPKLTPTVDLKSNQLPPQVARPHRPLQKRPHHRHRQKPTPKPSSRRRPIRHNRPSCLQLQRRAQQKPRRPNRGAPNLSRSPPSRKLRQLEPTWSSQVTA